MLELSTLLNSTLDLDFILGNILLSIMGKTLVPRGVLFVRTSGGRYEARTVKGLPSALRGESFSLSRGWNGFRRFDELSGGGDPEMESWLSFCRAQNLHVLAPMILGEEMIGVIALGRKASGEAFGEEEIVFIESTANIASTAVQNAISVEELQKTNRLLDARVQELNTLFEFSREMTGSFDEQKILRVLSYALMGQLRFTRYIIYLRDGDSMEPVLHKVPSLARSRRWEKKLSELAGPLRPSADAEPHCFEHWLRAQGMQAVLPLRSQNETRGALCVGEKFDGTEVGGEEMEYLASLANVCVSALENARLVREMIEKQRLERELNIAREIQQGLFPKSIPHPRGYDIAAVNISSRQIGGDYYEVMRLNEDEYVVAIADVSGKGIPASLLMANVQATLRVLVPLNLPLPEATARINTIVAENTSPDRFITFFWGILNVPENTLRYVNAGHNPPFLLRRDGACEKLDKGGMILGVFSYAPRYEEGTALLEPGDCLVLYTDGVTEAMSPEHREFTDQRLIDTARRSAGSPPAGIIAAVQEAIREHAAGAPQSDDITMLVLKREE